MLIIGGGVAGRELARRLGTRWEITLLEVNPPKGERLSERIEHPVRVEIGDGTSELCLKRAGIEEAETVVVATRDDEANLLAARLAVERFGRRHVLAVVGDEADHESFRALGVETVSRGVAIASSVESRLNPGRVTAVNVGLGRGELMEVTLLPSSPLVDRPLRDSHGRNWRLAALYRGEDLLLPTGSLVPRAGDRVVLVAQPGAMRSLVDLLSFGMTDFPSRYGSLIGIMEPDGLAAGPRTRAIVERLEAREITVWSRAETSVWPSLGGSERGRIDRRVVAHPAEALLTSGLIDRIGLAIHPMPGAWSLAARLGATPAPLRDLLDALTAPVLFERAESDAKEDCATEGPGILLALSPGVSSASTMDCALELARTLGRPLTAVTVVPPAFIAGSSAREAASELVGRIKALSRLYEVSCRTLIREGNPVKSVIEEAAVADLVVVGRIAGRGYSPFRPDVACQVVMRSPVPVLVLPVHLDR